MSTATPPIDPATAAARRAEGDRARDAHNWPAAAAAYQAFLAVHPEDAGIWVQYGHACKEAGDLEAAEAAYSTAAAIAPGDPDPQQHLAHLLKRLGRPEQAAAMFRQLLELAPTPEVVAELEGLGHAADLRGAMTRRTSPVGAARVPGRRYVEVQDLLQYLIDHSTVTGIIRVTLGLVGHVLDGMNETEAAKYALVQSYQDGGGVLLLDRAKMRRLAHAAMRASPDFAAIRAIIADLRKTSQIIQIEPGALYFIVGAFWEVMGNTFWLGGLKQRGVRLGAVIYDIIPVTHPQFCDRSMVDTFAVAFAELTRLLDFALTISEFVAGQVTAYLGRHEIAPFPMAAMKLAHDVRFAPEAAGRTDLATANLDELEGVRFVLCVCTIEARKNHAYLLDLWQRLIDEGGEVPDLVFVGRQGWRVEALFERIAASDQLDGRLHILHGVSDGELQALYDRCLFTVFPSFVEGWGLPVGESLARGKLCVASSATAIPEVGGEFAIYIDPSNLQSGYDVVKRLLEEPGVVAEQEARLRRSFVARTWHDVAVDAFGEIDRAVAALEGSPGNRAQFAPHLEPGQFLSVENLAAQNAHGATYARNPERLMFAQGWRSFDPTGTWMLDPTAMLRLRTTCPPGAPVFVMLHIGSSSWVRPHNRLHISASGPIQRRGSGRATAQGSTMAQNATWWLRLKGQVDAEGCLTVTFRVEGEVIVDAPHTPVALRFHAIGYAAVDDVVGRLDLFENSMFAPQ